MLTTCNLSLSSKIGSVNISSRIKKRTDNSETEYISMWIKPSIWLKEINTINLMMRTQPSLHIHIAKFFSILPFLKVKKYHWHIWNTSLAYDNCLDNLSICNKQLSGQYWQKQNKNIQSFFQFGQVKSKWCTIFYCTHMHH